MNMDVLHYTGMESTPTPVNMNRLAGGDEGGRVSSAEIFKQTMVTRNRKE